MQKNLYVRDLKLKQDIESVFYVKYSSIMQAKDGRHYMNVILSDSTGDLEARVWKDAEKYGDILEKGIYILVHGKLNIFQGKKQFIIADLTKVNKSEINEKDFVYAAKEPAEKMLEKLKSIVSKLDDYYIRNMLFNVLDDEEISARLMTWPAGKTIHHAYRAGLLEHILSCSELAVHLAPKYDCNLNYVVAGCVLHDLCKIYELKDGIDCEYTDEGKLVGHLVRGPEIVDKFAYRIKGFPYYTRMHLKHIMLSHHGELEYGSPKVPSTSEAMLVHLIDFMDSKMNAFETIKRTDSNIGEWSGYVKHLDRMIYKGSLPTFTEPKQASGGKLETGDSKGKKRAKTKREKELKQSLGDKLAGFKVGEE